MILLFQIHTEEQFKSFFSHHARLQNVASNERISRKKLIPPKFALW